MQRSAFQETTSQRLSAELVDHWNALRPCSRGHAVMSRLVERRRRAVATAAVGRRPWVQAYSCSRRCVRCGCGRAGPCAALRCGEASHDKAEAGVQRHDRVNIGCCRLRSRRGGEVVRLFSLALKNQGVCGVVVAPALSTPGCRRDVA